MSAVSEFRTGVNEYGVAVSIGTCTACGSEFSICPATTPEQFGSDCLADGCPSYDVSRDMDIWFEPMTDAGLIRRKGARQRGGNDGEEG